MIVDAHLDIAWNALWEGRGFQSPSPRSYMVNREALAGAGYGLVFASLFTAPASARGFGSVIPLGYRTPHEAHMAGRVQVGYYRSIGLELITTREQLHAYMRTWRPGRIAAVLAMENADPIETPAQLPDWLSYGVRVIGPAWSRTRYCGGTNAPGGLTADGRLLLTAMQRRGVILDLSHMADASVRDALPMWRGPLVATHAGARALCPRQRQLRDSVIRAIGERGGMIGVSLYRGHLRPEGRARVEDVVAHVDHFAAVSGDIAHVGLGSDLDGGFSSADAAIRSLDGLRGLREALQRRFGRRHAEGIMGRHWLRFLQSALPAAA